jgi:hypothetical protein
MRAARDAHAELHRERDERVPVADADGVACEVEARAAEERDDVGLDDLRQPVVVLFAGPPDAGHRPCVGRRQRRRPQARRQLRHSPSA